MSSPRSSGTSNRRRKPLVVLPSRYDDEDTSCSAYNRHNGKMIFIKDCSLGKIKLKGRENFIALVDVIGFRGETYECVYKGLDLGNGEFVAVKEVRLSKTDLDLNQVKQELDSLKSLKHKNIVNYLESFTTFNDLFMVFEYMENGSLADIVRPSKLGPFPEESLVAGYIAQILEGLVYLHQQGVIHQNIKATNIFVTKGGLAKLSDFGIVAKLTIDESKYCWMALEAIRKKEFSVASDIWSVGCTVIELLTGAPPYHDEPALAGFQIMRDEHPPFPDGLSTELANFLQQCFQKDAKLRPDAKTLLSHPWIQNGAFAQQPSICHTGMVVDAGRVHGQDARCSSSPGHDLPQS